MNYIYKLIDSKALLIGATEDMKRSVEHISQALQWERFNASAYSDWGSDWGGNDPSVNPRRFQRKKLYSAHEMRKKLPKEVIELIDAKTQLDRELHRRLTENSCNASGNDYFKQEINNIKSS